MGTSVPASPGQCSTLLSFLTRPCLLSPVSEMRFAFLVWIALGSLSFADIPVEIPRLVEASLSAENIHLQWDTLAGQGYQLETSGTLSGPWQPVGGSRTGDGLPMTYGESREGERKFYRVSVAPEDFEPTDLIPKWELDAQIDFPGMAEGESISRWTGMGISSLVQTSVTERPVLRGGAVEFDGAGDHISLPMWPGGIGQEWTLAVLMKARYGLQRDRSFFGCDPAANRALDFAFREAGLYTFAPGYTALIPPEECAIYPNENWRVLVVRSDGTRIKVRLDWYEGGITASSPTATTGKFNLGCGYWYATTSQPVTIRYAAFFPSALSDDDTGRMVRWLERRKGGESPPLTLIYAGGQSNYIGSLSTLRRELPNQLGNTALSFSRHYGSSPLNFWMRDKADLTGFEVCPFFDLSGAPPNTSAYHIGEAHSGTRILESWNRRTSNLAKHPKIRKVCIFIQGETDCSDATTLWKPNGDGGYNLRNAEPYWLADTYGRRSAAWNTAIRQETDHGDLVFIYERVAFSPTFPLTALQIEAGHRQRRTQLDAMAEDSRYLLVDTEEFPRFDGVHFSSPDYQAGEVPNTGTERFTRATVRLINASERLAAMSTHARLLAMRALDSGAILDETRRQACESLAAAPGFESLRSFVIPSLAAENAIDQERLRRCNLVMHLGGKYPVSFVSSPPPGPVATVMEGANTVSLENALNSFLDAWGQPGAVALLEVP